MIDIEDKFDEIETFVQTRSFDALFSSSMFHRQSISISKLHSMETLLPVDSYLPDVHLSLFDPSIRSRLV